ncbi:MAG TPA: Calx-beta domain-containing protein [Clostridia bacterium]|nr:Calx-beta domain-containing protein [Clostridia bacterium]
MSRPAPTNLTASFTVTPLSAQTTDFVTLSGDFQFAPGSTKAYTYIVADNYLPELDKTALLTFSSTNLLLARTNALLTIVNDDFPQVSVTNVTVVEGNAGFTNATFKVALSAKAPFPVDVQFQAFPGTAMPGSDYLAREGWLHFPPNVDSQILSVAVLGDPLYEPTETASLALLSATNALISSASALITIKNDDLPQVPELKLASDESGLLRFEFASTPGATYQLQSRTNLTTDRWKNTSSTVSGNGATSSITLPKPDQTSLFYRLIAW